MSSEKREERILGKSFLQKIKIYFRHVTKNTFLSTCGTLFKIKNRFSPKSFDHLMGSNPQ